MITSGRAGGRLHRGGGEQLHEVVDDDVAQSADRVVEVAAILNAEALGHRDLDALDVVAVPERLQHRVREAEVEDLLEAHLPEVVVDPVELRLVDVPVQLRGERAGRLEVVAERLLDHDARVRRQRRHSASPLDDPAEEERRDLEVEDRRCGAADALRDRAVGRGVVEVAADVRQPRGEPGEDLVVELLPGREDRRRGRARASSSIAPVVHRDAHDRAVKKPAPLEPVERPERHHPREVAEIPKITSASAAAGAPTPYVM